MMQSGYRGVLATLDSCVSVLVIGDNFDTNASKTSFVYKFLLAWI